MRRRTTNPLHYILLVIALVLMVVEVVDHGAGWAGIGVLVVIVIDLVLRLAGVYRT